MKAIFYVDLNKFHIYLGLEQFRATVSRKPNTHDSLVLLRTVFSTRGLTILHSGSSVEVIYVFTTATAAVNVGTLLLMEQNAFTPCQLMEYST